MKTYKFFEFIGRMGQIFRWSLMKSSRPEDLKQHSYDVAVIAHALATIWNDVFGPKAAGGFMPIDAAQAATYALFHDTPEIGTGDIPTPIKYFGGGVIKEALDKLETMMVDKLVTSVPSELQPSYREVFEIPPRYKGIVKAADQIAALKKCREEIAAGNMEFGPAAARLEDSLKSNDLPEVAYFMDNFMPSRPMTLDELIEGNGAWLLDGGTI